MAQYRFSAQVIGRASGRSSVAAAAYRAGTSLADERTGLVHDYSRRHGVVSAEIIAPDNAPDWMRDRAMLWNAVERVETRSNSQLAREIQFSLPHELDDEQRRAMLHGFVREQFVSKGMIADIAIHAPDRDGDNRNHHAHVMLTMRELTGEGFHASKATPTARAWNAKENLEQWREAWADHQNRTFRELGISATVDHRSLEARGVDQEPTRHLGPVASNYEKAGKTTRIGDENRAIEARNKARNDNHQSAAVISLALERLKRDEVKELAARQTALKDAQSLSALDLDRKHHGQQTALQGVLMAQYGAAKANLGAAQASIDSRLETTGWRKILRDITGRTKADQIQLAGITRTLADIRQREAGAVEGLRRQQEAERAAQRLAQANQQDGLKKTVAAQFEHKRKDAERTAKKAANRARFNLSPQQMAARVDRKRNLVAIQNQARPRPGSKSPALQPEPKPVKRDFETARNIPTPKPAAVPTERVQLSTPAPQPAPMGVPVQPIQKTHEVPKVDRAADWSKSQTRGVQQEAAKPSPATARRDFAKGATPAPAAPEKAPQRDFSRSTPTAETPPKAAVDFNKVEKNAVREIGPYKKPTQDKDRSR